MRFMLRWADEDGNEVVTASNVEVLQPSPQLTVLRTSGLWAEETIWTVHHNAGGVRIVRADWGVSQGKTRADSVDVLQPDSRLQDAMQKDLIGDGHPTDAEIVAQWVALLEDIECAGMTTVLPRSRIWAQMPMRCIEETGDLTLDQAGAGN